MTNIPTYLNQGQLLKLNINQPQAVSQTVPEVVIPKPSSGTQATAIASAKVKSFKINSKQATGYIIGETIYTQQSDQDVQASFQVTSLNPFEIKMINNGQFFEALPPTIDLGKNLQLTDVTYELDQITMISTGSGYVEPVNVTCGGSSVTAVVNPIDKTQDVILVSEEDCKQQTVRSIGIKSPGWWKIIKRKNNKKVELLSAVSLSTIHPCNVLTESNTCSTKINNPINLSCTIQNIPNGTSIHHQWQIETGSKWTNTTDGDTYSGCSTLSLTIKKPDAAMNNKKFRLKVSGNNGFKTMYSDNITLNIVE